MGAALPTPPAFLGDCAPHASSPVACSATQATCCSPRHPLATCGTPGLLRKPRLRPVGAIRPGRDCDRNCTLREQRKSSSTFGPEQVPWRPHKQPRHGVRCHEHSGRGNEIGRESVLITIRRRARAVVRRLEGNRPAGNSGNICKLTPGRNAPQAAPSTARSLLFYESESDGTCGALDHWWETGSDARTEGGIHQDGQHEARRRILREHGL